MENAGLIYDDSRHYIDHLAPFCALKKWPLIVCEAVIEDLAKEYYPNLEVIFINRWELSFPSILVACDTKSLIESSLGISISSHALWLPHGSSDKGWKAPFFEALQKEKTALVYGQKMIDCLAQKNTFPEIIRIGNFRWEYWLKHKEFYKKIVQEKIHLPPNNKTYLYAPTWEDRENNSTFWQIFPTLAARLPKNCNLIIKIHPNTYWKHEVKIEGIIGSYQTQKNILFLTDFTPIYPLLDICDAYIGDMSSIGYDFLKFNRPMFFLTNQQYNIKNDPSFFLYQCGILLTKENLPALFEEGGGDFTKIRKEIYDYTFN